MKDKNLKKLLGVVALVLIIAAAVSGCMNRGVNDGEITQPSPSPNYMPQGTVNDGAASDASAPAAFDWTKNAAQVEGQINRISELSDSRVVVTGSTALVGVKFDSAYRGEMTERIRAMIAAEIMAADPAIETVAVTADPEDVEEVYELSDRVLTGKELDELKEDINEIVRNATTLR